MDATSMFPKEVYSYNTYVKEQIPLSYDKPKTIFTTQFYERDYYNSFAPIIGAHLDDLCFVTPLSQQ